MPTNKARNQNKPINLHGKKFKSIQSSDNGEVNSDTIFEYRQDKNIIWATYQGGEILFGTLSGQINDNTLIFRYQHQNTEGEFMTGKCETFIESMNGKLRLIEEWEWTCNDFSKGNSVLEEIKLE